MKRDMQIVEWAGLDEGSWGPRIFKSVPLANVNYNFFLCINA